MPAGKQNAKYQRSGSQLSAIAHLSPQWPGEQRLDGGGLSRLGRNASLHTASDLYFHTNDRWPALCKTISQYREGVDQSPRVLFKVSLSMSPRLPFTSSLRPSLLLGLFALIALAAGGCASDLSTRTTLGKAGAGGARGTFSASQLAYGHSNSTHQVDSDFNLDPYLRPVVEEAIAQQPTVVATRPEPTPQPAAEPAPVPERFEYAQLNHTRAPHSDDANRYAEREQQSQELRSYRGGDAIVISAGTIVIVLLIVLLVVLLD